jgi:phosphoribosylanthranilate isomerase
MTRVKICGLRRAEDAIVAAEAGAEYLGFVFYERSRRAVAPELAREIIAAARERGTAQMAGVFVDADPGRMNEIARVARLDYVQLSGDEPESVVEALEVPAIQVIHMDAASSAAELAERIEGSRAALVLLDTPSDAFGGSGEPFDWNLIPAVERPILLAGGLHAGNVEEAIRRVGPWGVDVSSGVETAGQKDQRKIRAFIAAAKRSAAEHSMESTI